MSMIAGSELTWAARQYRGREAVIFGDRRLTYDYINRRANKFANMLRGLGLGNNDRVAVLLNNSVASVETVFGGSKSGTTYVALNARHTAVEHLAILRDAAPRAIVAGPEFEDVITSIAADVPGLEAVVGLGWSYRGGGEYERLMDMASDREPAVRVNLDDHLRLIYTSGTTGRPKGIVYSWRRYHERTNNFFAALEYQLGVDESMIHVGPLTHAAGNYLFPYYLRGARNVVMSRFDPEAMQDTIARERITHLLLVPTMMVRLLDALDRRRFDLSSICRINYGTAPTPVDTLRRGIEAFGPVFREHYGLSECPQPVTLLYPHEHVLEGSEKETARLASCGRPTMNINLAIHDPEGRELAPGEVGEIAIEASGVAAVEYWRSPETREETVRNGWLYTGDLGWMDEDGFLFIVGRSKDMIVSGGFNVYSREVEEVLIAHPGVLEAAVVGVPDPEWGEAVCAFVAPKRGAVLVAESVTAHCAGRIAGYKKPRFVELVDRLPRNSAGKIDKNAMRRLFFERHPERDDRGGAVGARY